MKVTDRTFRKDGKRVSVYNEGRSAYLFDASAAETVGEVLAASETQGSEPESLVELAAAGTLVMYELWQDDPICVEVALGDPLTATEKKSARWVRLVRVPIDLPTGKLRIESGTSLCMPEENPGALVEVPPGKYELALHRVNWEKMDAPKYEGYDGPHEVLTLRPWPEKKKFKPKASLIYLGDEPRAPWVRKHEITDGVFRGEVINTSADQRERRVNINLDEPAFRELALERGMRLELIAADRSYVVLCQGRMISAAAVQFLGEKGYAALAELDPRLLVGFLSSSAIPVEPSPTEVGEYRPYDYFVISTITTSAKAFTGGDEDFDRLFDLQSGARVALRVCEDPFFVLDRNVLKDWHVEGDELHGKVLSCTPSRLYVNVDHRALGRIGFEDGDTLELEIAGTRRTAFDRRYLGGDWFDVLERATLEPLPEDAARAKELSAELYNKHGELLTSVEGWEEKVALLHELEIHPEDRAQPPLVLDFGQSKDHPGAAIMVCQSAFHLGPLSPDAIHVGVETDAPVVIRRVAGDVVRR